MAFVPGWGDRPGDIPIVLLGAPAFMLTALIVLWLAGLLAARTFVWIADGFGVKFSAPPRSAYPDRKALTAGGMALLVFIGAAWVSEQMNRPRITYAGHPAEPRTSRTLPPVPPELVPEQYFRDVPPGFEIIPATPQ